MEKEAVNYYSAIVTQTNVSDIIDKYKNNQEDQSLYNLFYLDQDSLSEELDDIILTENNNLAKEEINEEEECIINIEELADHYAVLELSAQYLDFSPEVYSDEYNKCLAKHKTIINTFKRKNNE